MTTKNFIFSMKPYDVDMLFSQVSWMLQKRVEFASRKKFPGLWKLTDKLNTVPRATEAELNRRRESRRRWGGLLLVMGIFLFVPGVMKPQELPVPLVAGFFAIVMGVLYLRKEDRKKNSYEKKAKKLLENMNASMKSQKLRLVFDDTEVVMSGVGEDKKISYINMECALETADLFGVIYENQIVLLQKKELLLGTADGLTETLKEKTTYEKI